MGHRIVKADRGIANDTRGPEPGPKPCLQGLRIAPLLLQKAYDLRPNITAYRDALIRALGGAERFDEAAVLLEQSVNEALNHPKWDVEKRFREAANLRNRHKKVFNSSGLADKWIGEARTRLSDAPTSASLHNYLADMLLENGQRQVALSHYLVAAVELNEPDFFVKRVMRFNASAEDPVAQMYYRSLIYHLPEERKALQAVDRLVQPYRNRGRRFALTDEARSFYEEASKAAAYILTQPGLEPEHWAEAEFRRIEYHYEPLDGQPEEWQRALEELDKVIAREGVSEGLQKRIARKKADIYIEHLNNPDRAYAILEPLFEKSPDSGLLGELFTVAFKRQKPPAPNALKKVAEQELKDIKHIEKSDDNNEKRKLRNMRRNYSQYQVALASWYYEMGDAPKAESVLESLVKELDLDDRQSQYTRNSTRRFSRAFHAHLTKVNKTSLKRENVMLTQDRVVSTEYHKLGKGQPAHVHYSLQLQVPENLALSPELILRMQKRPAVSNPPAFFAPTGNQGYLGTLRPLMPEVPGTEQDVFDFSLSSHWDWVPYSGDVSVEIEMKDMGGAQDTYLAEIAVTSKQAYKMEIELHRWSRIKGDPEPKPGRKTGRKLIYENQSPTTDTLGRTYHIPMTRQTRWEPDAVAPSVEIMIIEEDSRREVEAQKNNRFPILSNGPLADSAYLRLDAEPASGTLPVLSKQREVYRIGGGR